MAKIIAKTVFVVDDDEMLSAALEDHLKKHTPHHIHVFDTGEKCLESFSKLGPDIVVLDYKLNSVDEEAANGLQILDRMLKLDPALRVIMLSSQEAYGTALQTLMKGAQEYVIKDMDAFAKIAAFCNA